MSIENLHLSSSRVYPIEESCRLALQHKVLEDDSSSSQSDDDSQEVVVKALQSYCSELDGSTMPSNLLQMALYDHSCLICLSGIKRIQAVWSCKLCYCLFHLVCIQQWAKDSISLPNMVLSEDLFPSVLVKWSCPKCRGEYNKVDVPSMYLCFCGKKIDPSPNPWLLSHSCGEVCGRDLESKCGHKCLSLCHPGPCPPCPKTMMVSCYCGQSSLKPQRCGLTGWSCGSVCKRVLTCGLHTCESRCHKGPCEPCSEQIMQACQCSREIREQPCDKPLWSCGKLCNRLFPCGHHFCQKECHSGSCGDCPRSKQRTCPCGKAKYVLDCMTEVPCCGDTCSKALNCGKHWCVRQCHSGECGPCLQRVEKYCRCGQKKRSVSCNQSFFCESRCQKMRQCGRHQCRRKCCGGNCLPCEQICGRLLGCKTHKCPAPCHSGRCYPCVLTVKVSCTCGKTTLTVPCGRERSTKPPRCNFPCNRPPTCHHTQSTPHHCHIGQCPPCREVCSRLLTCGHLCQEVCHSSPLPALQVKPVAPWKKVECPLTVKPCPPCSKLVSRYCHGGHEYQMFPCSEATEYSCGRLCGRMLKCGNHSCRRACHVVLNASSSTTAGEDCLPCEEPCTKLRHPSCHHQCSLPCHSGDCPPCESPLKFVCHCSSISIYIKCSEWCKADGQRRNYLKSCNNQCSKMLSCGHHCLKLCHAGSCTPTDQCHRKVTVRCPCRRIKKEWRCNERQEVVCGEECLRIMMQQKETASKIAAEALAVKEMKEKEAVAAIERQLRPRKRRRKLKVTEDNSQASTMFEVTFKRIVTCLACLAIFILLIYGMVR